MSQQGEKIQELTGKITGYRALDNGNVEVSFQGQGRILGVETMEIGTYISTPKPGGVFHAEGWGCTMTKDGEVANWKGLGVGKPTGNGGFIWRYTMNYTTPSAKLARLNTLLVTGDWEVDNVGNAKGAGWEWR
jgi:hypothetical protein